MEEALNVELFFKTDNDEIKLTPEGHRGVIFLLKKYHGNLIREIAGITRSAMVNYKNNPDGKISKRGRDGIESLANYFNSKRQGPQSAGDKAASGLAQYSDKEIFLELIRRGYQLTKEI